MERDYGRIVEEYLDSMQDNFNYSTFEGRTLEEAIFNTINGTLKTIRLGRRPLDATQKEIISRIKDKVALNRPIEVSSAWGAVKTLPVDYKGIDFIEYLTIKQFQAIDCAVKKIYPPGIRFNIYLGDSYYEYLYGYDPNVSLYCSDMKKLTHNIECINLVQLSDLCNKCEDRIDEQCHKNFKLLKSYWNESEDISVKLHEKLPSYSKLKKAGWVGYITPAMRKFYLKRMSGLYSDKGRNYWEEKILHFFAYGLMISQNDLMGRKNSFTSTIDACLLRVPPPDMPRNLYSNRLRFRIIPETISKLSAPSWTVIGVVCINRERKPHFTLLDSSTCKESDLIEYSYHNMKIYVKIIED